MIIILILIAIGISISYAFWKDVKEDGIPAVIICSVILTIVFSISIGKSYHTYLGDRAFYTATKEQYHSAIKIYADYALIDMGTAAFTDLKYQGYQDNISSFITTLRNRIIEYNISIVKKRVMGKNILFNWLIVKPYDDMLIIIMKALNNSKTPSE